MEPINRQKEKETVIASDESVLCAPIEAEEFELNTLQRSVDEDSS